MSAPKAMRPRVILLCTFLFFVLECLAHPLQSLHPPRHLVENALSATAFGLVTLCFEWWRSRRGELPTSPTLNQTE